MTNAINPRQNNTDPETVLSRARQVLTLEAEALQALGETLDGSFAEAVQLIHEMKTKPGHPGRLIIAGIGKSGHVARKVAATLASTGTPSYFVHPGEASHGDLGMITDHDIVLMFSNSGENSELSDLIHYTRRYDIPLIAMTSRGDSTLGKHADVTLRLPEKKEACPNGLAPTTSTTMMMALGDALAVTLLERTGLTPAEFHRFHPGGKLGQRLQSVADLMHGRDDLPVIPNSAKMDEALLVLTGKNLGAVLVTDETGALQGIITDGDLKRHMGPDLLQKPVTDVMTTDPKTIRADALAVEAVTMMTRVPDRYLTSLIVVDDSGALHGMIRLQDCLQAGIT